MQDEVSLNKLGELFAVTYQQTLEQIVNLVPQLLVALGLLLLGLLVATLLARGSVSLLRISSRALSRLLPWQARREGQVASAQRYDKVLRRLVFWLVMLFFISAVFNILKLEFFSRWINEFFSYFPQLLSGMVIIVAGFMFGRIVKAMVVTALESAGLVQISAVGSVAQVAILVTALVVGVEQLGINVHFLTQFFITIAAVLVAGFSLAFGLGSRRLVENLIGVQQARKTLSIGDEVMIAEQRGVLVSFTSTALLLESGDKTLSVPGHLFSEMLSSSFERGQAPRGEGQ